MDLPRQRNTREENERIRAGEEPSGWNGKKKSHDTEARWTRKGDEKHFGYKNHIKVSRKTKMVEAYEVTDASVHDSQGFGGLLDPATDREAYADSAYRRAESGERLGEKGIGNQVHDRAYRNRPLDGKQKDRSKNPFSDLPSIRCEIPTARNPSITRLHNPRRSLCGFPSLFFQIGMGRNCTWTGPMIAV